MVIAAQVSGLSGHMKVKVERIQPSGARRQIRFHDWRPGEVLSHPGPTFDFNKPAAAFNSNNYSFLNAVENIKIHGMDPVRRMLSTGLLQANPR